MSDSHENEPQAVGGTFEWFRRINKEAQGQSKMAYLTQTEQKVEILCKKLNLSAENRT